MERANSLARIGSAWPALAFLSYGMLRAWLFAMYNTEVFHTFGPFDVAPPLMQAAFTPGIALTCLALALAGCTRPDLLSPKVGWAIVGISSAGLLLAVISPLSGIPGLGLAGLIIASVGAAWVTVRCALLFTHLSSRSIFVLASLNEALGYLVFFFMEGTPAPLSLATLILLPVVAMFFIAIGTTAPTEAPDVPDTTARSLPSASFNRFIISVALLALAASFSREYLFAAPGAADLGEVASIRMGCAFFVACGIALYALYTVRHITLRPFYLIIVVSIIIAMMLIPLLTDYSFYGLVAISVVFLPFKLIIWCICCRIGHNYPRQALFVVGMGAAVVECATVLGWCASFGLSALSLDLTLRYVLSLIVILILVLAALVVFRESDMAILGDPPSPASEHAPVFSWDALAAKCGLSPRERDVLPLLASGRSSSDIADKLCISGNTVKTHVKNIYAKMGVHTRQEFVDFIEYAQGKNAQSAD